MPNPEWASLTDAAAMLAREAAHLARRVAERALQSLPAPVRERVAEWIVSKVWP